jgi:hypothetical protein
MAFAKNVFGMLDLVVVFDMASLRLNPQAKTARLTGWLKNGQAFIGEDKIRVAPSRALDDSSCR